MSIVKGQQTVYIRDHDSLDPFGWAGGCSALDGILAPVGDVEWRDLYDAAAFFQGMPDVEVEAGPRGIETTLTVRKDVRAALVERWLRCRWDVDVRYQECPRRDDPLNWVSITRLCDTKFLEYASDGPEVVTRTDDDGVMLVSSAVRAPWPLVHLWRLNAKLLNVSPSEDFTSIAVCEQEQCADAVGLAKGCTIRIGTTGTISAPQVWTSDDETNWTVESLAGWTGDVEDIACLGDFVIVVSYYDGAVMWKDANSTDWVEVDQDTDGNPIQGHGVYVWDLGDIVVVGEGGRIWRSQDAGRTFTLEYSGGTDLYNVVAVDSQVWWAIGDDNAVVKTEDEGETWEAVSGPAQAGVDVTAILALDENRILLGYADGTIWLTEDGGASWDEDKAVAGFDQVSAFAECGCGRVVAVGNDEYDQGVVYESVDFGAAGKWYAHDVPSDLGMLADAVCCDANNFYAVGSGVYLSGDIGQILKLE